MKTELTRRLESMLFYYCYDLGQIAVEEVNMPGGMGIVDTLSVEYQLNTEVGYKKIWRFYEIKVTKNDFYSKNITSFFGHLNYYVLPEKLFPLVEQDIPPGIGVLKVKESGVISSEIKAKKRELLVDESFLERGIMKSLAREIMKAKEVEKGLAPYKIEELSKEIIRRNPYSLDNPLADMYEKLFANDKGKFIKLIMDKPTPANQREFTLDILQDRYNSYKEEIDWLYEEVRSLKREKRKFQNKIREINAKTPGTLS